MQAKISKRIIKEYEKRCDTYTIFTNKLEKLVKELLKENDLRVHSVASRVKTRASLKNMLAQADEKFFRLADVPDISGLRIITYFADDVDAIAEMIEREFNVDKKRSVDKRELLDPDRFGYLSLHYVVKLSKPRLKLTEYKRFINCHAEIQIRSILQHAWAEIEHDLGYKSKYSVPKEVRRRFSRLAGLLELADDEFIHIRDDLHEYERNVTRLIAEVPEEVSIDKASLSSFIRKNSLVRELDRKIALSGKIIIGKSILTPVALTSELRYVGINNIAQLQSLLREEKETITRFAELWLSLPPMQPGLETGRGICLFYLCYVLVGQKQSVGEALNYVKTMGIGSEDEAESIAEDIVSLYREATNG